MIFLLVCPQIPDVWGAVESYAMGNGYALIQVGVVFTLIKCDSKMKCFGNSSKEGQLCHSVCVLARKRVSNNAS